MKRLITPSQMRAMEQRYFAETGTASIDLMEVAASALCAAITRRYGTGRTVYFACGPGGNGGDGYACARLYARGGGRCAPPSPQGNFEKSCFRKQYFARNPCFTGFSEVRFAAKRGSSRFPFTRRLRREISGCFHRVAAARAIRANAAGGHTPLLFHPSTEF